MRADGIFIARRVYGESAAVEIVSTAVVRRARGLWNNRVVYASAGEISPPEPPSGVTVGGTGAVRVLLSKRRYRAEDQDVKDLITLLTNSGILDGRRP